MKKEIFEKGFKEKIDKNFLELSKYYDFNLEVFCEFNTLIFEINNCLLLELNRAAITLTNHLLERLLKLALIKNDTGIGPIEIKNWNEVYQEPNEKYGTFDLGNSIERCKKIELISKKEKSFLFDIIRVLMRNGFSHADSSKILADLPDNSPMFQGSFTNQNGELKKVNVNQKIIPTFQAIQMENFAKDNAKTYFDFVFHLIFRIEKRLIKKLK
jgi:hypothetical protein